MTAAPPLKTKTAVNAELMRLWNTKCTSRPKIKEITPKRSAAAAQRLKEWGKGDLTKGLEVAGQIFDLIEKSDFLNGKNGAWVQGATFDWVMTGRDNGMKVLEGNYDNPKPQLPKPSTVYRGAVLY